MTTATIIILFLALLCATLCANHYRRRWARAEDTNRFLVEQTNLLNDRVNELTALAPDAKLTDAVAEERRKLLTYARRLKSLPRNKATLEHSRGGVWSVQISATTVRVFSPTPANPELAHSLAEDLKNHLNASL
ncbi:MAG: hypothetical protein LIP02_08770 [Bacteroidales bacterium]|nr:hypothetical protein [Bacteroidales bacterium]